MKEEERAAKALDKLKKRQEALMEEKKKRQEEEVDKLGQVGSYWGFWDIILPVNSFSEILFTLQGQRGREKGDFSTTRGRSRPDEQNSGYGGEITGRGNYCRGVRGDKSFAGK